MLERADTEASRLPTLSAPQFVGRDREVAAFSKALAMPPSVVLIDGEAGVGKTRLLRECLASQPEHGHGTLVGACPQLRVPYTLGAVVDAVRDGIGDISGLQLSGLGGALRPLFPEWAADLPPAPEPMEDASAARHRLFRALVEVLGCLNVAVLALEDVHWADEATLEFLLFLVSRRPQPVSVVVTYRREELPPGSMLLRLSSRLPADAHLVRMTLEPLGVKDTAAFISSMLTDEHVSTKFAAFLHERTDGIPLALEESVRLMHDRADVTRRDGGWARRRLDNIEVPPTIRDAVLERVERIQPDTRTVLHAASVLASPADYETLNMVTSLPHDRAAACIADGVACGLLREDDRGLWSFRHSLARQAVYDAIPAGERRALHARAGRILVASSLAPAAQLARHFRLAGDVEASCRYTEQAADLSVQTGDVATAALLLHNLVTTVALPPEPLVRLVRKIQFQSLPGSDPYTTVIESLEWSLQTQPLTPGQEALIRFQIGRVHMVAGAMEAGRLEILRAVPALPPDSLEASRARILLALPLGDARPVSEHLRWLDGAPVVAPSISPHDRLRLLLERAFTLLMLGEESGWTEARKIPDSTSPQQAAIIAAGHTNLGEAAMRWGRYGEAKARLAKARALTERYELLDYLNSIASSQLHLDWFTGAWSGLASRTAQLIDDYDRVRLKDRCEASLVAGLFQAAAGDRSEAEARLRFAGRDDQQRIEAAAALAQLSLRDGHVDEALRLTDGPIEITVESGIWPRATEIAPVRISTLVAAGRLREAAGLTATFERTLNGKSAPAPEASLLLCRAILAQAAGDISTAAVLFDQAATAWQAVPRPYDALLAREHHACCLLAAGQPKSGLPILAEVWRALSALGAHNDADRVERNLNERGWDTRPTRGRGRPSYGNQLSPRELEVARLLVGGLTNRQIAEALVVSAQTVASQLRSAMRKLHVASRIELAVKVVESGLVNGAVSPPSNDE
ncbi:ATP-binding protein [Streptomyces sp. NPDC051362]|uniref:ATP-binding protein n=1 Tax=Streptomyces sp. NPDC051362 TaxID=3365651 RepID=UPI00379BFE81